MATSILVRRDYQKSGKQTTSLEEALMELGLSAFEPCSVEKYKERMASRATPFMSKAWILGGRLLLILSCLGVVGGLLCVVIGAITSIFTSAAPPFIIGGGIVFFCSLITLRFAFILVEDVKVTVAQWELLNFEYYTGVIPEFALQTVNDLRERFPAICFGIDELSYKNVSIDPFLVVMNAGGGHAYIEVWNEPGFIKKRIL